MSSDEKSKGTVLCAQLSWSNLATFQNFDDDATVNTDLSGARMDRFVNSGSHEDTDDVGYARRGRGGGRGQPQAASKKPDEKQQPAPGCRACSDFKAFVKAGGPGTKAGFVFVQLFRLVLAFRHLLFNQDWTNAARQSQIFHVQLPDF